MSKRSPLFLVAGLIISQVFFPFNGTAQGNLLLTPRRIVFEGSTRSIDLNLANVGKDTATYAISIVQIRMTEEGNFETITEPDNGQNFAGQNLRFFPRSVTLGPNETQTVKIQLVRANQLAPGEYRSHFYFRAIPKEKPLGEGEVVAADPNAISVMLTPIFGITIPAIIRVGESTAKVNITDVSLDRLTDTVPRLSLKFNRSGDFSVFGDLAVDHISTQGKVTRVGVANGIAVYTPNTLRRFSFNLNNITGVDLSLGKLRLTFSAPSDVKPEKYAEAELVL
ncbi:MAG TPA: Fn3-like domain-containing protein [Bacteroidales bacterium]|nr:Fn3-like domain-containing protein [Bacteroidales bacterium]